MESTKRIWSKPEKEWPKGIRAAKDMTLKQAWWTKNKKIKNNNNNNNNSHS